MIRGTEEEIECKFSAAPTMNCKLSSILFIVHEKKWLQNGKGLMACKSVSVVFIDLQFPLTLLNSAVDAGIKMRPTNEELSSMSPEFDHRWRTFFADAPDKPVMFALPYAECACI